MARLDKQGHRPYSPPLTQAVEQFRVDRAVLPIENSLGVRLEGCPTPNLGALSDTSVQGSIHRNFDLLLRHRLHIVGEVRRNASCNACGALLCAECTHTGDNRST